jgi:hypothetical protein
MEWAFVLGASREASLILVALRAARRDLIQRSFLGQVLIEEAVNHFLD